MVRVTEYESSGKKELMSMSGKICLVVGGGGRR